MLDQGLDYVTRGFEPYLMRPEVLFVRGLLAHARDGFEAIERPQTRERVLHALLLFAGSFVADESSGRALLPEATQRTVAGVAADPPLARSFASADEHAGATMRGKAFAADAGAFVLASIAVRPGPPQPLLFNAGLLPAPRA